MGRTSTRLYSALPGKGRPESGSPGGTVLDTAVPNRGLPGTRDPLAEARDRFLAAEPVDRKVVREPILASWWRSRDWRIAADRLDLSYLGAPDLETTLARAAEPVLRHLHEQLDGQPISIILTDATGRVLRRLTGDRELERQLDTIMLIPGFSYAEDVVGTNGIGTALESGGPTHVFGHEHYAERLEGMACAGVPLRDPLSGKTIGVIDLTCWRRDADPLMLSLVSSTADQLGQALTKTSNGRDLRLLQEYTRACRHTGGIVLALGNDVVMLNDHARRALSPADQAELISQATETLSAQAIAAGTQGRWRAPGAVTVDLPSGAVARMFCRPVGEFGILATAANAGPLVDGVVHVKLVTPAASPATEAVVARAAMALPGLVGSGAAWRRAGRVAEASYERGEWLALEGEHGVGKLALVRAVHQRRSPAAPCHVLDAADAAHDHDWLSQVRTELAEGTGMLVLRHVHLLNARQVRALAGALQEARDADRDAESSLGETTPRGLRVAVTLDRDAARADLAALLRQFPGSVAVPPLRHHSEDLRDLVPFFLGKLSQQCRVTCSPAAMQLLLRHTWPGNAAQLWQVLKQVVQRRRAGQIMPEDLPPECWTVSRRVLSPLESIERDAIVQSLLDHAGNKIRAARALGMSRATIYRRIREYGIVTPDAG
ncbi:MAG: Fis family transcriptional regulator [Actinomycetia bacterium]|jgi:transcriptional regulator of acetoin/glycerol metabolism|nr:Fis family transcriptional regulator [Actinomycetes bacterium]